MNVTRPLHRSRLGPTRRTGHALAGSTSRASKSAEVADDHTTGRVDPVRGMVLFLGNVAVLTALLAYIGRVRSDAQAQALGIDDSILGMSTEDYVLRSVSTVLMLVVVVAAAGLAWVLLDRWLLLRLRRRGSDDRTYRWASRLLPAAGVALPLGGWLGGPRLPTQAYVAFPLLCAAGLLLILYAFHLRAALPDAVPLARRTEFVLRASTAVLVGVAIFTGATAYATLEGHNLAREFERRIGSLPGVIVHSVEPLNINAPGVELTQIPNDSGYQFQYRGLRLLDRVDSQYFLIHDTWTREAGVVIALNNEPGVRFEFARLVR